MDATWFDNLSKPDSQSFANALAALAAECEKERMVINVGGVAFVVVRGERYGIKEDEAIVLQDRPLHIVMRKK